jgi:hypothetical protein
MTVATQVSEKLRYDFVGKKMACGSLEKLFRNLFAGAGGGLPEQVVCGAGRVLGQFGCLSLLEENTFYLTLLKF